MQLQNRLQQAQKPVITQSMQQSLKYLQMPLVELDAELRELSMSNPFLDIGDIAGASYLTSISHSDIEYRDYEHWNVNSDSDADIPDTISTAATSPLSYTDYLNEQLGQMRALNSQTLSLCRYIVGCLNSAGYLDCPVDELAQDLGVSRFDIEQALFIVQSLDPPGTGARSLSECLVLQLAQSNHFNEFNLHVAQYGLAPLSRNDFSHLAKLMNASVADVKKAADIIRSLNPIPSQGFYTGENTALIIPEVVVVCRGNEASLEYNKGAMNNIRINEYYSSLIGNRDYDDAQPYLKEKLSEAKAIVSAVRSRMTTVTSLIEQIVSFQHGFFTGSGELKPMTMQEIADAMGLNVSTVSRAARDKYVQINGKLFAIKSLLTNPVYTVDGKQLSANFVKGELVKLIRNENPQHPLTDEALCRELASRGVVLSRRTIAKYRDQLGIAAAHKRKILI